MAAEKDFLVMESTAYHTGRDVSSRAGRESCLRSSEGFTLIELLVVIGTISLMTAIALPVFGSVNRRVRITGCLSNTKILTMAEILRAEDYGGRFAPSVATIWSQKYKRWDYYYPNTVVNVDREPREHRSQSEYYREYIDDPDVIHCPESPSEYGVVREFWEPGDEWEPGNFMMGTKCFWRNYEGLSENGETVKGPKTMWERGSGKVLVNCLLNYGRQGHEKLLSGGSFSGAGSECPLIKKDNNNFYWPELWSKEVSKSRLQSELANVRNQAGFVDGHVESRRASDFVWVWVINDPHIGTGKSKGKFFLPVGGMR